MKTLEELFDFSNGYTLDGEPPPYAEEDVVTTALRALKHGDPSDEDYPHEGGGGGGGGGDSSSASSGSAGRGAGTGIAKDDDYLSDDGKYHVKGDVEAAVRLIGEGKDVVLEQPHELSTLLDKLVVIGKEASASGEKRVYDLCRVSVSGTNLFCAETAGYARVDMPQLSGRALPGSIAEALPHDQAGGVNATLMFVENLQKRGYEVRQTTEDAGFLRATQRELDGAKVAGMMQAIQEGKIQDEPLVVSRDNYIIDGHHRWAAKVALGYSAQVTMEMPILKVDILVVPLVEEAKAFANKIGIPQRGVGKSSGCWICDKASAAVYSAIGSLLDAFALKHGDPSDEDYPHPMGEGGGGGAARGRMASMFERVSKPDGGFTYQPATDTEPTGGFAVSIYPERSAGFDIDQFVFEDLVSYAKKNGELFEQADHYIGAWHDPVSHRVFLDVSVVKSDAGEAAQLALGHDQIAYFDLGAGKSVTVNAGATSGGAAKNGRKGKADATERAQADRGAVGGALRAADGKASDGRGDGRGAAPTGGVDLSAALGALATLATISALTKFDQDQERDDRGRWTDGGGATDDEAGGGDVSDTGAAPPPAADFASGEPTDGILGHVDGKVVAKAEKKLTDEGASPASMRSKIDEFIEKAKRTPSAEYPGETQYEEGMKWYAREHERAVALSELSGGRLSVDQAAGVLAAMSPRTSLQTARAQSESAVRAVMEDGTLEVTVASVEALYERRVEAAQTLPAAQRLVAERAAERARDTGLRDHVGNYDVLTDDPSLIAEYHPGRNGVFADSWAKGLRIARGEAPRDVLGGNKVRSFYDNMRDPDGSRSIAIDGIMAQAMTGMKADEAVGLLGGSSNKGRYEVFSRRVTDAARSNRIKGHQAQAIVWIASGGGAKRGTVPPQYIGLAGGEP